MSFGKGEKGEYERGRRRSSGVGRERERARKKWAHPCLGALG